MSCNDVNCNIIYGVQNYVLPLRDQYYRTADVFSSGWFHLLSATAFRGLQCSMCGLSGEKPVCAVGEPDDGDRADGVGCGRGAPAWPPNPQTAKRADQGEDGDHESQLSEFDPEIE